MTVGDRVKGVEDNQFPASTAVERPELPENLVWNPRWLASKLAEFDNYTERLETELFELQVENAELKEDKGTLVRVGNQLAQEVEQPKAVNERLDGELTEAKKTIRFWNFASSTNEQSALIATRMNDKLRAENKALSDKLEVLMKLYRTIDFHLPRLWMFTDKADKAVREAFHEAQRVLEAGDGTNIYNKPGS